jgi:hypothetical protein
MRLLFPCFFLCCVFSFSFAEETERIVLPIPKEQLVGKEAKIHSENQNGWKVITEHYEVHTNHSSETGVQAAKRLEHLYHAWNGVFADILPKQNTSSQHRVLVYRDKKDYAAHLRRFDPQIGKTNGYYYPPTATSYFFPVLPEMNSFDAETTRKALLHEGTHQLFYETLGKPRLVIRNNFWIVEGIAMFMETLKVEKAQYILGDISDNRLYAAKVYQTERDFYVPISKLVAMDVIDFQTSPNILPYYAQSAALTHYLMFTDRKAVLELLHQVYDGTANRDTLSKLTGQSYRALDGKYLEFIQTVP